MSPRRWLIPLAALAIAIAPALASTAASASTHSGGAGHPERRHRPACHHARDRGARRAQWRAQRDLEHQLVRLRRRQRHLTSVSASWVQPTGTCSSRTDQYSSFWVGLDGYSSDSVEQDGTDTDCVNGKPPVLRLVRDHPNPSYNFGSTVKPGDTMTASATYEGSNEFKLTLADTTRGWSSSTTQDVSGAARSSAEVIIEAPCCTNSGGILPLADFGTVQVSNSVVDGSPIGDLSPVQIYMTDSSGKTRDTVPSLSSEENFSATRVRAN